MSALLFGPTELTADERALQAEVRAFLAEALPRGSFEPGLGMGAADDPAFSRQLGARGWLGMALPRKYGGGDRSAVDRFIVTEELLRWGAPVAHHWVADRQSGPVILRFGTEQLRERFLPGICRGELSFCIGMSEPDAGSDLASVATRAEAVPDGWLVNGTKIWTTGAHHSDWMLALCRTSGDSEDRHRGLSQLIIDLRAPGVDIRPIPFLDGTSDFNEVVFTDVFVPDDLVLGELGAGWQQVSSELAFERGGPERWLSTYATLDQYLREQVTSELPDSVVVAIGGMAAQWWGLRRLSLSVARQLDAGRSPMVEAALAKDLATRFEQDTISTLNRLLELELTRSSDSLFERLLARATLSGPAFTIRGGTTEILRSVTAKGLR